MPYKCGYSLEVIKNFKFLEPVESFACENEVFAAFDVLNTLCFRTQKFFEFFGG